MGEPSWSVRMGMAQAIRPAPTAEAWYVMLTCWLLSVPVSFPPQRNRPCTCRPSGLAASGPTRALLIGAGPAQRPPGGGVQRAAGGGPAPQPDRTARQAVAATTTARRGPAGPRPRCRDSDRGGDGDGDGRVTVLTPHGRCGVRCAFPPSRLPVLSAGLLR